MYHSLAEPFERATVIVEALRRDGGREVYLSAGM